MDPNQNGGGPKQLDKKTEMQFELPINPANLYIGSELMTTDMDIVRMSGRNFVFWDFFLEKFLGCQSPKWPMARDGGIRFRSVGLISFD